MKKIVLIVSLLVAFTGFSFAQTTQATGTKKPNGDKVATTAKPATTATTAKPATTVTTTKPATTATIAKPATTATIAKPATTASTAKPIKKDGTPDMRYKSNKDAAKAPPVHLKKDGTPDKRYKENKPAKTS